MSTQFPVSVRIGAALDGSVGAAFGGAKKHLGQLGDALREVESRAAAAKRLADMQRAAAAAMAQWRNATNARKAFEQSLDGKDMTAAQARHLDRLVEAENRASRAYRTLKRDIDQAGASMRAAGVDTERLAAEQARLGASAEKVRGHYVRLGQAMAQLDAVRAGRADLRGQLMDSVGMGAALYGLMKPAIEFESVMADVDKVMDFSEGEFGLLQLGQALKGLARTIPVTQAGLAEIAGAGARMGVAEADLATYTETVAKMSAAWEMAPDAAGTAIGKIKNVMGLTMAEVALVGDAVNLLDDRSTAKASEILDATKRTSGIGKQFGLSTQQLAALNTAMIDLGKTPEIAATGVNALLGKLSSAPAQSKKFKEALEGIGWSAEQMQQAIGQDAQGTLTKFLEKIATLDKADQANALAELFGAEYADDISALVGGLDKYRQHLALVSDQTQYQGSVQREFEKRSKTTANQLKLMGNGAREAAINIGTALLPALNQVIGVVLPVTHALADFASAHPDVTAAVVGTAAALIGLKAAFIVGGFVRSFGAELLALGRIARATAAAQIVLAQMSGPVAPALGAATAAMRAFGLALAVTPIGWIVAGVTAIAVAGGLIYTHWQPISAFVTGLWDGVAAAVDQAVARVGGAMQFLQPAADMAAAAFRWIGAAAATACAWINNFLAPVNLTSEELGRAREAGQGLGDVIGRVLVASVGLMTAPLRGLVELVQWGWGELAKVMGWAPGETLSAAWSGLIGVVSDQLSPVTAFVGQSFEQLAAMIGFDPMPIIQAAWAPVATFIDQVWSAVVAKIETVLAWIEEKVGSVRKTVSWLTLGAFGEDQPPPSANSNKPPPQVGVVAPPPPANSNKPAPQVGAVAPPPPANSNKPGPQSAGNAALATKVASAPQSAPVTTVNLTMQISVSVPSADLAAEIERQVREGVRRGLAEAERAAAGRRDGALYDQ